MVSEGCPGAGGDRAVPPGTLLARSYRVQVLRDAAGKSIPELHPPGQLLEQQQALWNLEWS